MSNFEKIVEYTRAKPRGSFDGFVGYCPIHEDETSTPSFVVSKKIGDINPLVHCFVCEQEELIDHFKSRGMWSYVPKVYINPKSSKSSFVEQIWNEALPLTGSCLGSTYLKLRGLKLEKIPNTLRFHKSIIYVDPEGFKSEKAALVAKITKDDHLVGIQRIYIDEFGKCIEKKMLGECNGGYVKLGDFPNDVLHEAEGIETSLAIFEALDQPVWAAVTATNLSKVNAPTTVKTIHLWADKDLSKTEEREAFKAANKFETYGIDCFIHLPKHEIEVGKKSFDYLDLYNLDPAVIALDLSEGKRVESLISPITKPKYLLPEVTEEYLPLVLRDWVLEQSDRLSVPREMIVVNLFSILGSLLGRRLVIQPKKYDPWKVYANLWGLIISPPGTKKTPSAKASLRFLEELERNDNEEHQRKIKEKEPEIRTLKAIIASLARDLKNAVKEDENTAKQISKEISLREEELSQLETSSRRYLTSQFTMEKMIELCIENPNGLLISKDELNALFSSFKKQGNESVRPFLLEAWNGDGWHPYDTLSRGTRLVNGLCLTILGGIQPSVIERHIVDLKRGIDNDGLIQRFQMIAYPNVQEIAEFKDVAITNEHDSRIKELIIFFAKSDHSRHGFPNFDGQQSVARLSNDAYVLFAKYMDDLEKEIAKSEESAFKDHLAKLGKLLSGLILMFHVVDNFEMQRPNREVMEHIVKMAILWTDLFKAHAKKLYDIDHDFASVRSYAVAKKIVEGKIKDGMSIRAIYQNKWSCLKNDEDVEAGVTHLEKLSWLTLESYKPPIGGRPSAKIRFNKGLSDFLAKGEWFNE